MSVPPWSYFVGSAVFHYLGPSFAVLLFSRVEPLGVAGLRIWSAALVFVLWRRPWRTFTRTATSTPGTTSTRNATSQRGTTSTRETTSMRDAWRTVAVWGAVLAAMNSCFYLAIARLPLATVAAIEFLPVIGLAALGMRTSRNLAALAVAVAGVYLLTDVRLEGEPLGFVFAFANAGLFALYVVVAHRAARSAAGGIDGLAMAMLAATVLVLPIGGVQAVTVLTDPVALAAGIGVGVSSSVVPYVCDQLAMARLSRATYALMVALLPATTTAVGLVVLRQVPDPAELAGISLVIAAVSLHRGEQ
jgi:inner membrane transporter RhtA